VNFHDEEFRRFLRQRQSINARMDQARAEIDAWIDGHSEDEGPPSLRDIARLEALLRTRMVLTQQLGELFEMYISHLLEVRRRSEESER